MDNSITIHISALEQTTDLPLIYALFFPAFHGRCQLPLSIRSEDSMARPGMGQKKRPITAFSGTGHILGGHAHSIRGHSEHLEVMGDTPVASLCSGLAVTTFREGICHVLVMRLNATDKNSNDLRLVVPIEKAPSTATVNPQVTPCGFSLFSRPRRYRRWSPRSTTTRHTRGGTTAAGSTCTPQRQGPCSRRVSC